MQKQFLSQFQAPTLASDALWFIFKGEELLLRQTANQLHIPILQNIADLQLSVLRQQYLGTYESMPCFAIEIEIAENKALPIDMHFAELRQSYETLLDNDLFAIASRAKQILNWDKSTQFCGYCGHPTQLGAAERVKICTHCQTNFFPQIAPVVLVRINRQDQLLLARSPHFSQGVYSVIAGFIEPGESAEQAVHREVAEEVGIEIKNVCYFGSQPWPFPSNLMLAFTAEYASGDLKIDNVEIEDAQWFSMDQLPKLPKKFSLSRQLVDDFHYKFVK